jgi:hypothetical protein
MIRTLTNWIACLTVALLLMALVLGRAAHAQEAAGAWHGVLSAQGMELRVGVELKAKPGGALEGVMLSPEQTPDPIPLDKVEAKDGVLTFGIASLGGSYEGRWDAAQSAWVGKWSQVGVSLPLTLQKGPVKP